MIKRDRINARAEELLRREVQHHERLRHPNIVRLYTWNTPLTLTLALALNLTLTLTPTLTLALTLTLTLPLPLTLTRCGSTHGSSRPPSTTW